MLGMTMGVMEAVALSIVIGVSVDYIIHLAYAFNNSVFESLYYKSRAALLARTKSIISAATTTAGSAGILLMAIMIPLHAFGAIFLLVTIISFFFSLMCFVVLLMLFGPVSTYEVDNGTSTREAARQDDAEA